MEKEPSSEQLSYKEREKAIEEIYFQAVENKYPDRVSDEDISLEEFAESWNAGYYPSWGTAEVKHDDEMEWLEIDNDDGVKEKFLQRQSFRKRTDQSENE